MAGVVIEHEQIKDILKVMREISPQCKLLADETYHGMRVNDGVIPPSAAILGPDVITVSSMSKTYGLPGTWEFGTRGFPNIETRC